MAKKSLPQHHVSPQVRLSAAKPTDEVTTRYPLPGHPWNVVDLELPDTMAAEATRQLSRLVVLALIGEKHYSKEVGTGGDNLDLIYDLAWTAEHYASITARRQGGA
jgi:hypothetical protein